MIEQERNDCCFLIEWMRVDLRDWKDEIKIILFSKVQLHMATRYNLNTDHWSKMRMNVSHLIFFSYALWSSFINEKIIKNAINVEQRGRVISWEKHQKLAVQRELEAAIRGSRSLPQNKVGLVHNFQDILTAELDGYLPGSSYFRRRAHRKLPPVDKQPKNIT
jgi:hypothetical protein